MAITKATQNVISPNICTTDTTQTISGTKTFQQKITGDLIGDIYAPNGTTKVLENGTGSNATFTGDVNGGTLSGNASSATVIATGSSAIRSLANRFSDVVNVKDFGAVGDYFLSNGSVNPSPTDDTVAFTNFIAALNAGAGIGNLGNGSYLVDAGTIVLTHPGIGLIGAGKGNCSNLNPSTTAPTSIIIKGTGVGIRIKEQSITLSDFRLTSDDARAALPFDIAQSGVRVEANDTSTARADRTNISKIRIDNQPGDGILSNGLAVSSIYENIDIYQCKGFGMRFDDGSYTGITRTNKNYPGLSSVNSVRIGYCGGHAIALSNPTVTTQAGMAIRMSIFDMDSFGNGITTSIMYPSTDGKYYDYWIFGENCIVEKSGPCGRSGLSLTPEVLGGIWISGRDNEINNCRFVDTTQPIYVGYVSAQPTSGLDVRKFRIIQTLASPTTHTAAIKVQNINCVGIRCWFDRYDYLVNPITTRIGAALVDAQSYYRGEVLHLNSIFTSGSQITIDDDKAVKIKIRDASTSILCAGILTISGSSVSAGGGIFHCRVGSLTPATTKWAGQANTDIFPSTGTGALTGNTGPDTFLNISCDDTSIYIENRRGFQVILNINLSAFPNYSSIESITNLT